MSTTDVLSVIKDFVLMIGSGAGIYFAATNLNTWKRQLSGQSDHALARNLLVNLFKYKNAIERIRHPFISSVEMGINEELDKNGGDLDKAQYIGTVKAYTARWKHLNEVKAEFQTDIVEAHALWGAEFADVFKTLAPFEIQLHAALELFVQKDAPNQPLHVKQSYEQSYNKKKFALELNPEPSKDVFMNDFLKEYENIEKKLREKLHTTK